MEFKYRGWVIDATQDFSLGQFFAHARLIRAHLTMFRTLKCT
jgi:hypothetical protein